MKTNLMNLIEKGEFPMLVLVRRSYDNSVIPMTYLRSTTTMWVLKDDKGNEYRFRKCDGTSTGNHHGRVSAYNIPRGYLVQIDW